MPEKWLGFNPREVIRYSLLIVNSVVVSRLFLVNSIHKDTLNMVLVWFTEMTNKNILIPYLRLTRKSDLTRHQHPFLHLSYLCRKGCWCRVRSCPLITYGLRLHFVPASSVFLQLLPYVWDEWTTASTCRISGGGCRRLLQPLPLHY